MPGVNWETCTIQLGEKGQSMSVTKLPHIINYKKYSLPPMLKSFIFEPKVVERVCATDSGRWVAGYRRRPDFSSSRQSVDTLQSTRNLYWWVAWSWLLLLFLSISWIDPSYYKYCHPQFMSDHFDYIKHVGHFSSSCPLLLLEDLYTKLSRHYWEGTWEWIGTLH